MDNPEKLATYGTQDEEKHNTIWNDAVMQVFSACEENTNSHIKPPQGFYLSLFTLHKE